MKITASPIYPRQKSLPRTAATPARLVLDSSGPAPLRRQNLLALVGPPQPPFDRVAVQTAFLSRLRQHGLVVSGALEARNALDSGFSVHSQGSPELGLALTSDANLAAKLPADTVLATSGSIDAMAATAGGAHRGLRSAVARGPAPHT